ncbi:hypothetical protein D3C87_2209850 [compost metagenome]
MLYREDRGWGFTTGKPGSEAELAQQVAELRKRIEQLEGRTSAPGGEHKEV